MTVKSRNIFPWKKSLILVVLPENTEERPYILFAHTFENYSKITNHLSVTAEITLDTSV